MMSFTSISVAKLPTHRLHFCASSACVLCFLSHEIQKQFLNILFCLNHLHNINLFPVFLFKPSLASPILSSWVFPCVTLSLSVVKLRGHAHACHLTLVPLNHNVEHEEVKLRVTQQAKPVSSYQTWASSTMLCMSLAPKKDAEWLYLNKST